ncbi:MAG: SGNH/GDSL hydrolase family protein [Ferruginibacter sp.]
MYSQIINNPVAGVLIITGILFFIFFLGYFIKRFSHSKSIPFYPINKKKDSLLTIGIIGDSWVTHKKLDKILHDDLLKNGFKNRIISAGQSGAKSKAIYHNLFKDPVEKNSSKFIIENQPDFCIVIAGVNDAVGQMGSRYYAHHLTNIIKTLCHYNIQPAIVSLPNVGIKEMMHKMNLFKQFRNLISAVFNNGAVVDNIQSYRKKFYDTLVQENLKNRIIFIDYDQACEGFSEKSDLYYNPIHLSPKGNEKLGRSIADILTKEIKKGIHA